MRGAPPCALPAWRTGCPYFETHPMPRLGLTKPYRFGDHCPISFCQERFCMMRLAKLMGVVVLSGLLLVACTGGAPADKRSGTISVIATTSIIGDVVQQVGGEAVAVEVLLAADTDPHTFEPTPRQVAAMTAADVIFINGFGLEEALQPVLDGVAAEGVR
ncbi:MAG: zinc ABC transporter substrate-binding protein, partial [Caldilineae bacterium]